MFISRIPNSNYQGKRACIKYSPEEILLFKKKIKSEFYSSLSIKEDKNEKEKSINESFDSSDEILKVYHLKYSQYIFYSFNSQIVNMIILYFNLNKSLLQIYKLEQNFIYNLICLLKSLMMNEIEVAYFSLLLDNLGWKNEQINNIWIYLTILGIITKKKCFVDKDDALFITIFSRKYPKFDELFTNFISDEKICEKISKKIININLVNKRFIELTKPINSYCRRNYVILDGIIDKIINLSQSYNKKENSKNPNKNIITPNLIKNIYEEIDNFIKEIDLEKIRNLANDNDDFYNIDENIFNEIGNSSSLKFNDI